MVCYRLYYAGSDEAVEITPVVIQFTIIQALFQILSLLSYGKCYFSAKSFHSPGLHPRLLKLHKP